jgi:hypothetical protein
MANRTIQIGGDPDVPSILQQLGDGSYIPPVGSFARAVRTSKGLHRSAITSVDKVTTPSAPSVADVATGGGLSASTTYNCSVAAGTTFGPTPGSSSGSVAMAADASNTHVARVTIAQSTNAEYYDLFLSTAAQPLWVARVTEAQRAAGVTITAVGTVNATSPGAGKVDIRVVGTGLANNVAPFSVNNAYVTAGITPIDCTGFGTMQYYVQIVPTDLRSIPTTQLSFMSAPAGNAGVYSQFGNNNLTLLTGVRSPLYQSFSLATNAAAQMMILIDTISGQGTAVSIWVDLV